MMKILWSAMKCYRNQVLLLGALLLFVAPVSAADVTAIYQQEVPEMTTLECAKCHVAIFETLRDSGGLHQQACRDCHDTFHTFTPDTPWAERVPSCSSCHDYPHGEEQADCMGCHKNAHAPIASLVISAELGHLCSTCHQQPAVDLALENNAHADQDCVDCHQGERHGERPQCNMCHEDSHTEYVDNAGCTACHPHHQPNNITYGTDVANDICAGCHDDQLEELQASEKKHKLLTCVVCHADEHGNVTGCTDCHDNGPHNPILLKNFESCSDCHGDPHGLKL